MPYNRPTLQTIIDRIISDFNTRVDDARTFLRRSVFRIMGRVYGGACHLLYDFINFVKDQLFVSTADVEHLERHGSEYGIFRNFGEKAEGDATASGTVGIIIPKASELQSASGNLYLTNADYTIGAGGVITISLTAKEVGVDYNENFGITLTFVSPISGISSTVSVSGDGIVDGADEETDDQYRTRILNRKRQLPHGGAEDDYKQWALEYSGSVTRAWTIPQYQGAGTIGLAFVQDNEDNIFPDDATMTSVKNYIIEHTDDSTGHDVGIPVTAEPGFFIIPVSAYTMNFTVQLSPNTATVQASIIEKLEELILQRGGAGQTITVSQIYEALTQAVGEEKSKLVYPASDVAAPTNRVHVLGTVTFQEYTG